MIFMTADGVIKLPCWASQGAARRKNITLFAVVNLAKHKLKSILFSWMVIAKRFRANQVDSYPRRFVAV